VTIVWVPDREVRILACKGTERTGTRIVQNLLYFSVFSIFFDKKAYS